MTDDATQATEGICTNTGLRSLSPNETVAKLGSNSTAVYIFVGAIMLLSSAPLFFLSLAKEFPVVTAMMAQTGPSSDNFNGTSMNSGKCQGVRALRHHWKEFSANTKKSQPDIPLNSAINKGQTTLANDHAKASTSLDKTHLTNSNVSSTNDVLKSYLIARDIINESATRSNQKKMLLEVTEGPATHFKQRTFRHFPNTTYVQYSAYRVTSKRIAIAGMVKRNFVTEQVNRLCSWHDSSNGNIISGSLTVFVEGHSENREYTGQGMWCDLTEEPSFDGGYMVGTVGDQELLLYSEDKGQLSRRTFEALDYNLSYCSPPMFGKHIATEVRDWLLYHKSKLVGIDHFTMYNVNGIDSELSSELKPFLESGTVDIVDVSIMRNYDFFLYGQILMINDCMYKMATASRWVIFLDFDEYLEALPPHTLSSILQWHAYAASLSQGTVMWDITKCVLRNSSAVEGHIFTVEKAVFRAKDVFCLQQHTKDPIAFCRNWQGHRKLIVNPRKVQWAQVHKPVFWEGIKVHLNTKTELRHNHYRKIAVKSSVPAICSDIYDEDSTKENEYSEDKEWVRDDSMAKAVASLRKQ